MHLKCLTEKRGLIRNRAHSPLFLLFYVRGKQHLIIILRNEKYYWITKKSYSQKEKYILKKNRDELFSDFLRFFFSESPGLRLSQGSLGKAQNPDRARFTRCLDKQPHSPQRGGIKGGVGGKSRPLSPLKQTVFFNCYLFFIFIGSRSS